MNPPFENIVSHAQRVSQFPQNENARSNLVVRLQLITDVILLKTLARQFALSPEVSWPVWRRIAALSIEDSAMLLETASAYYRLGADDDARCLVDNVLARDEESIPAWELKAALCADPVRRREIFERILKIDPGNRTAVHNLIILGRPTA